MKRILVILLTYGEPDNHRFREHYRYSHSILRRLTLRVAKIPRILLPFIAFRRAWDRVREWKNHDVVSPLESITGDQALALGRELGENFDIQVAYEFRSPMLVDKVAELRKNPPQKIVLVPLYTVDSDLTSGISKTDLLWETLRNGDLPCPLVQVSQFNEDPEFVRLMGDFFLRKLNAVGWKEVNSKEAGLILGCHGTVLRGPPGVDTGLEAFEGLYRNLAGRLAPLFRDCSVGWMNHVRGGPWTQPDLGTAIQGMALKGIKKIVYFPFGFLADANETTHESRHEFERFPGLEVLHLPCLNKDPAFIRYLAARVRAAAL